MHKDLSLERDFQFALIEMQIDMKGIGTYF